MNIATKPQIVVKSDYDGYFERFVRSLLEKKEDSPRHDVIEISAGPYRAAAISYASDGRKLHLDFYSALRAGFGSLSADEVKQLTALL